MKKTLFVLMLLLGSAIYADKGDKDDVFLPATNVLSTYLMKPTLGGEQLKSSFLYGIGFDIPMYRYLTASWGFKFGKFTRTTVPEVYSLLGNSVWNFMGDLSFKAQYPFEFAKQHLIPYLGASVGLNVFVDNQAIENLAMGQLYNPDSGIKSVAPLGLGPCGSGFAGIEYFPYPLIGIFAEAGYQTMYLTARMVDKVGTTWNFKNQVFLSPMINFGIKIAL